MTRLHVALVALLALALLLVGVYVGRWSAAPTEARRAADEGAIKRADPDANISRGPVKVPPPEISRAAAIQKAVPSKVTASGDLATGPLPIVSPPVHVPTAEPSYTDGTGIYTVPSECCLLCSDALDLRATGARIETAAGAVALVADAEAVRVSDGAVLARGPLRGAYAATLPPRLRNWSADVTWWAGDGWTAGVDRRLGPVWAGATIGSVDGRARVGIRARVEW